MKWKNTYFNHYVISYLQILRVFTVYTYLQVNQIEMRNLNFSMRAKNKHILYFDSWGRKSI